jgi:hypothetical protein
MAKIKRIGDKKAILKKKKELTDQESFINSIADNSEKQLDKWFKDHFSTLPEEVKEGLEVIIKAVWANAKVTKNMKQSI